jgi:hypothetical protein
MTLVVYAQSTDAGWAFSCNDDAAEIRLNADRYGAHEVKMPKGGIELERALVESALLTVLDHIHANRKSEIHP